ncbi:hypothetical protein BJ875DRAFT_411631 [Amylocarpus encephaloides]|uniref:Aminoglycoside phosphotransferase domain-containing protein n=1 Tax=Amylocarpus encephaloides TaxID=45428 RepID=A0A9P8C0M6_9HELO|nr:hypothetical protein BJ875DRAFT_411631 [Amylocarpus encephaloides]
MSASHYSLDTAITEFFSKTSTTRELCDSKAIDLAGGKIAPVEVQGNCSYSVYAGPKLEFVVQFRLKSLVLKTEIADLARKIYGSLAPSSSFHGEMGHSDKEPVLVYLMDRVQGISHLDFILSHDSPDNSDENFVWRKTLMKDVGHFFALSWKAPQEADLAYRQNLRREYFTDLQLLLDSLPARFHPSIQKCLDSIEEVLSLPMILLHRDFGTCNIMVDEKSCHLTGVIDWAEAEICPFGQNLHSLQALTGKLHLKNGWRQYKGYEALWDTFWSTFQSEVGGLSAETVKTIKIARTMGLLLSHGFTKRLANMTPATPIRDDEIGRYNMLYLDGFLINPSTRFNDLN